MEDKEVVDLNSEDIFEDKDFDREIRAEADFGMSEILPLIEDLQKCKKGKVLEVGCGTGLLVAKFANQFPELEFSGMEPIGAGFDAFAEALEKILGSSKKVDLIRAGIEEFESDEKFDLIYSINVFEHLPDWREAIQICLEHLNEGGELVFLCPNYDVPYEPHFSIPIFKDKERTRRVFKNRIDLYHKKVGSTGPWDSLNFIKASEVKNHSLDCGYQLAFDRTIFSRMLGRLTNDPSFSQRHGFFASIGKFAMYCGFGKLAEYLPCFLSPYMKVTITRN